MDIADATQPIPVPVPAQASTVVHIALADDAFERRRGIAMASRLKEILSRAGTALAPIIDIDSTERGLAIHLRRPADAQPVGSRDEPFATIGPSRMPDAPSAEHIMDLFAPVVDALVVVHDAGVALGGISMSSLWRRADGRVILICADPRAAQGEDIQAIAAMLLGLIPEGSIPSNVASVLLRAVDAEEGQRPTMMQLANAMRAFKRTGWSLAPDQTGSPRALRRYSDVASVTEPMDPVRVLQQRTPRRHARRRGLRMETILAGRIRRRSGGDGITGPARPMLHPKTERSSPTSTSRLMPMLIAIAGSSATTWVIASIVQ